MINLPIDLNSFGFVQREKNNGSIVKNKCGRDFLYYVLHYLLPTRFNANFNNPEQIESRRLFGFSVPPSYFSWTQLQFYNLPVFLKENNLILKINKRVIYSFLDFISAILFSRISYNEAINIIETNIKNGKVIGIDIGLKFYGLMDHVMFVYGFDEEYLYVFDTHKVPYLEYEKTTNDARYIMKLSRIEAKKRWTRFGRVWEIINV